ncbi:MAG: efflux RND transporter periplasmic adaptor subunit [Planctomycetota bacterium]|nr:efflux RND transporter periplasmic adaptor subunit [Planctomycetota bacterium]
MVRVLIPTLVSLVLPFAAAAQDGAPMDAAKGPPPTPVKVAEAREESLAPRRKVFGEVRASERSTVATEEGGVVREVLVAEGVRVAKGAPIARLDPARIDLEIKVLGANAAVARATLAERELGRIRAERDLELLRRAAAQGGTNPRELADAESGLAVAAAQVAQAKAAIAVLEQQGALLAERRKDHEIVAPFAGVVTKKHAEPGAWLAAGGAVVDLVGTEELEAWFDVPQELFDALARIDAAGGTPTAGGTGVEIVSGGDRAVTVGAMRIVPDIDLRSRTFRAVLRIERSEELLAPGLSLTAYVPRGPASPRIVVPKDAVLRGDAGSFVFAVRGGLAVPVPVRIAFPAGDSVALEPGSIERGTQVVTEGNERLMPMTPVAPIPAGTDGAK